MGTGEQGKNRGTEVREAKDKGTKDKEIKDKEAKGRATKDKGTKDKGTKDKGTKDKGIKDKEAKGGATIGGEPEGVRINKYLSEAGICSRREADRQVALGNVTIDGKTATEGDRVLPGQEVVYQGRVARKEDERILLLVNKPVGIVCTTEKREKDNIIDFLHYPKRIYPVGRLDKDSSGLLLMTNQGDLVNEIMRARNYHEKEYVVTVNKTVTPDFVRGLSIGVPLKELHAMTRECEVEKLGQKTFRIVLTQGLNRQIRRMCEYFGYRVVALERVRIMNLRLGDLAPGAYREATDEEWAELMSQLGDSSDETPAVQAKQGGRERQSNQKSQGRQDNQGGQGGQHGRRAGKGTRPGVKGAD